MIEHLSYSSISSYLMCGRAWRYHYLDKVPAPSSGAQVFGNAAHRTIESYIEQGAPILDLWHESWKKQLELSVNGVKYDERKDESEHSLCNLGVKMFSDPDTIALVDSLKPLVIEEKPQIELKIELRVPGVPIPIVGYIDMIEQDGVPCDFKTSARSWNQDQADSEMQPTFYLAALNQIGHYLPGSDSKSMAFRHYVFVKTKKPQVQIWESSRTAADLFWLFGLIRDVWQGISTGVFPPNPGTWKCSARHCEYYMICRGGV